MGYTARKMVQSGVLVEIGAYDWNTHLIKVVIEHGAIDLTEKDARTLLELLPKAIDSLVELNGSK